MNNPDEHVSRSEYEQFIRLYEVRHQELRLETKEFETDIKAQINSISNKMDTLSIQVNKRSLDVWKLVATSTVSLIIGYSAGLLQHLVGR